MNKNNPLISYSILFSMVLLGLTPYLLMSAAYGTANTEAWSVKDASSIIMISAVIILFGVLFYVIRENNIDAEAIARSIVDIDELQNKKYLDFVLAHYGNVASVAAFLAAMTYTAKAYLPVIGTTTSSLIVTILMFFIFSLYGLVFTKTAVGAIRRKAVVWLSLLLMLLIDVTLFTMAIKGVPQPT
ncbi:hypothetical protein [Pseudomonas costantinii]|uniref:hypothetical protein n=1 Tax=Pseudomonas costantinii TaxID=168469 RepID=UPI0015A473B7|nr:hypothetical protein [Pseudomonas costantinii]NVZ67977.1 hypothetical protein [Pseudomonas costantinii]